MDIEKKRAYLVLADGTVFNGFSMGAEGETIGEVVFNTCTSSYQKILSDPTYYGQLIAQTYPLVGNRGFDELDEDSAITANGYIAREWCDFKTDIDGTLTLDEYLKRKNIVGICGIDTRRLTRKLRDKGYFNGAITQSLGDFDALIKKIKAYNVHGAVEAITVKEPFEQRAENPEFNVVILDYGFPRSMLDSFLRRGCNVKVVPALTKPDEILAQKPDGIVFSNGPGDPDDNLDIIDNMKKLIESQVPCVGFGVGHQMMVLCIGGRVDKMPKGHRGSNQPVRIVGTDKFMVTTQNHGYEAAYGSIGSDIAEVFLTNVNDNSIEGLRYLKFPGFSVQLTPLDYKGCSDSSWIYDDFIKLMKDGVCHE